jgi:hypothetical protein
MRIVAPITLLQTQFQGSAQMKMMISAALIAVALSAAPAAAVTTISGSIGISFVGLTANTPSINVGTTFTNSLFSVAGSAVGDFDVVGVPGTLLTTLTPLTVSLDPLNPAFEFTSPFGDFIGTVSAVFASGDASNRIVNAFVIGTFTPLGVLMPGFIPGAASATFGFTQTGINGAISGSFTLASPPADNPIISVIPEPAMWSMLIAGFGLVGFSVRRKRFANVAA